MLKKENRLTKRKYFNYIYKKGQVCFSRNFIINYYKSKALNPRFGFSVSKKIGKAVVRNLVKRRLRAIIQLNLKNIKPYNNYIITCKSGIEKLSYLELKNEVETCFIKNRLFEENYNE